MTTSGTNTFNLTGNEIIDLSLARIGVKTLNRKPTNEEILQARKILNAMVKSWKNKGLNLWKSTQGTLFLTPGQRIYKLDGVTANATESYTFDTIAVNAISGAMSITVNDPTKFTIGYFIGIMQDDNTSKWTTITNIVGPVITLASALTANASIGNYIYCYQTKINRPEGVSSFQLFITPTQSVSNVIYSNNSYFNIPTLETTGISNIIYYDKQLTYGNIDVWPVPNVNTYLATFTFQKQFDDFNSSTDTPDFPPEWLETIYLGLAERLLGVNGKSGTDPDLIAQAKAALQEAEGYDREDTSIYIQPATDSNIYTYR
jgi:hypothetical protein